MKFSTPKDDSPKQEKPSKYSYKYEGRKIIVTDNRANCTVEVYQEGDFYKYTNFQSEKKLTPERAAAVAQAMLDWYYYIIVKKNAYKK